MNFHPRKDPRTPECEHDKPEGCFRCCSACDHDKHRCGNCGDSMSHYACSGNMLGWCGTCRDYSEG